MKQKELIFLISQPRSGSTLTQRILGSHSKVYTRSEPWIMLHSMYGLKQKGFETEYNVDIWKPAFSDFINNLENSRKTYVDSLKEHHLNLYDSYLHKEKKRFFLDKTPRYYFIIDELYETFPKAKYILLIRNPLSVLYSILTTWVKNDHSKLQKYKYDLLDAVSYILNLQHSKNDNKIVVHYEKLLQKPHSTIQSVCKYCDLKYSDSLIENFFKNDITQWRYGDPHNAKSKDSIDNCSLEKWKEGLNSAQTWRFLYDYLQMIGKKNYEALGYEYDATLNELMSHMPQNNIDDIFKCTEGLDECLKQTYSQTQKNLSFSKDYNSFFEQINDLKEKNDRYLLYGNGTIGKTIRTLMPENIMGYVDQNDSEHNVENIQDMEYDKIIITVLGREQDIVETLHEKYKIPYEKLITLVI